MAENTKSIPEGYTVQREGEAKILQKHNETFYNPAQVVNRDLSLANLRRYMTVTEAEKTDGTAPKAKRKHHGGAPPAVADPKYADKFRIMEGLAASGLRAIRFAKELKGKAIVDANDMDPSVVESMKRNIEFNDLQAEVIPHCADARVLMVQNAGAYDAVDLDPYGTPSTLLDSAVQAVVEGGMLMVTATDMAVLCGNNADSCWSKYGSFPLHRPYCHEQALRILLACLESHANRHKRYIKPMLSLSIDFYIRVFVRVYTSPSIIKEAGTKLAYIYQSQGCDSFFLQPVAEKVKKGKGEKFIPGHGPVVPTRCEETGSRFLMGGPIWSAPIHDESWIRELDKDIRANKDNYPAFKQISSIMTTVLEELLDVPLYLNTHEMSKTLKCTPPKHELFRSALVNAGYRVSSSHANPLGVKTDAPMSVVWDIMRCWVKDHPVKQQDPQSYCARLLAKGPKFKADFSRASAAMSKARMSNVPRFLPNPEENWGPKARHGRPLLGSSKAGHSLSDDDIPDAKKQKQNNDD
mmetsp:Transcript_27832/g.49727  ORF Transcript_27832/g.49727 Transcript_27832/m.49727 type:complete len:523 (-) Transcript_27832:218-1786(-)